MSKEAEYAGLLKIGELAEAAGLSVSTVKYYVKEGLVSPARKTGPNMAYYAPDCVDRIRLIKTLQKERFYPLSVIRDLLAGGSNYERELGLLDAIHKVSYQTHGRACTSAEAARLTGLSRSDITALTDAGVVKADRSGKKPLYAESELRVMELVRRRMEAGMTLQHSITAFQAYESALNSAVRQDIDSLVGVMLHRQDLTTDSTVRLIQLSDETLDAFISLRRAEANRRYGSLLLEELGGFAERLTEGAERLRVALRAIGLERGAEQRLAGLELTAPGEDPLGGALHAYSLLLRTADTETVQRIMACGTALDWFSAEHPACADALSELIHRALAWLWLQTAPTSLPCTAAREAAEASLCIAAERLLAEASAPFLATLRGSRG